MPVNNDRRRAGEQPVGQQPETDYGLRHPSLRPDQPSEQDDPGDSK
jgi:hypothetical protein